MKYLTLLTAFLLSATSALQAYVLNINSNGVARHWGLPNPPAYIPTNSVNPTTHAIRYYLASDAFSATNTAAELDALRACFGQWLAVSNTVIKFEEAGLATPPVDVSTVDHSNIVYWVKNTTMVNTNHDNIAGASGVTFVTFTVSDNTIIEGDIVFNGFTNSTGVTNFWFTDFNDTANPNIFIEGVALHEIGHFLGLAHSPVGGATMLFRGGSGLNTQAGLSDDDAAGGRFLYAPTRTNTGAIAGTVTKNGNPVFGAAVYVQTSASNILAGTVTRSDGKYEVNMLPPGSYEVRVAPLDTPVATRLTAGVDIDSTFGAADTSFLPTGNTPAVVTANTTNSVNFSVSNASPAFRITRIRRPASNPLSYSVGSTPSTMTVGQSNYTIGVGSSTLPTTNGVLTITGDGLTIGATVTETNVFAGTTLLSVPISISSNATPGLRSFVVSQLGTNVAYANGFLEILPAVPDYNWDGLDDRFQRQYFAVFTSTNATPDADPDGDKSPNSTEFFAGTNPTNSASFFAIQSLSRTNNANTIRWQSVVGKKYQASYRTNVTSATWLNFGSVVTAFGTTSLQTDTTATNANRYYRIQILP